MNTAVAEIDPPLLPEPMPERRPLKDGWARLSQAHKIRLLAGVVLLSTMLIASLFMGKQTEWKVLFSNLPEKDTGAVIAQLAQLNIPYKYTEGGQAILVPAEKVYDTRVRLASQGLPKSSVGGGFDSLEPNRFGMTQFQERLTYQRGLEGELTRSIETLAAVQSARIHLALPNQNGFFREQQKPSASVLLTLHAGRTLEKTQIAGIVHLLASSVPEMDPKAVSVVDENGMLLSKQDDQNNDIDLKQLQYVQTLEQSYTKRVMAMLEPVMGKENVRAQVTAEVDFTQSEQTSETHNPNQAGAPSTVRSQQTVENKTEQNAVPPGVPGAASNVPPGASTAPINGQAQTPGVTGANGTTTSTANNLVRKESVTNYEVDKTVRVTKANTGSVKRLTAAVVVNYRPKIDAKTGKESVEPLPAEQLEQMKTLVQEAIGFSKERGDSVNIMNAAFSPVKSEVDNTPIWQRIDHIDLAKNMMWPVTLLFLGLIIVFGMIRPSIKLMKEPPPAPPAPEPLPQLEATVADENERPELSPGMTLEDGSTTEGAIGPDGLPIADKPLELTAEQKRLEAAKQLALENPLAVANIIKAWVNGE